MAHDYCKNAIKIYKDTILYERNKKMHTSNGILNL